MLCALIDRSAEACWRHPVVTPHWLSFTPSVHPTPRFCGTTCCSGWPLRQPTHLLPPRPLPFLATSSGPAGLFAALSAASAGLPVVLLEKGQPVEQRGRDIGALFARGKLNPDSNLCYGKGVGAAGLRPAGREMEGGIEAACRQKRWLGRGRREVNNRHGAQCKTCVSCGAVKVYALPTFMAVPVLLGCVNAHDLTLTFCR